MPLQNRVTPFGDLIATEARGLLMGNRGRLHDAGRRIVRYAQGRRWIACLTSFRGRRRAVMSPGSYTELRPGCFDVHERVRDMNANGVLASMNFPTMAGWNARTFAESHDKDGSRLLGARLRQPQPRVLQGAPHTLHQ